MTEHTDTNEQIRRMQQRIDALEEIATAARCYYTCTGIPITEDDLQMCRDNLNRAIIAERELHR